MDIKEKRILVSLLTSVILFVWYAVYVYNNYILPKPVLLDDFHFWGRTFMIFVPIGIVSQIIIHIVFAIIIKVVYKENPDEAADERDKLIQLKAIRWGHYLLITGFFVSMTTVALGMQLRYLFLILITSGFVSSIVEEVASLYYYRKGM